jgi:hypothetical protein
LSTSIDLKELVAMMRLANNEFFGGVLMIGSVNGKVF